MIAAWGALIGFIWLTAFQVALTAGAPLGAMAWGGEQRVLSPPRRIASAAVALTVGAGGALLSLQALGGPEIVPADRARRVHIGLAILFGLSLLANVASASRVERAHGVPLTLLLVLSNAWLGWML